MGGTASKGLEAQLLEILVAPQDLSLPLQALPPKGQLHTHLLKEAGPAAPRPASAWSLHPPSLPLLSHLEDVQDPHADSEFCLQLFHTHSGLQLHLC